MLSGQFQSAVNDLIMDKVYLLPGKPKRYSNKINVKCFICGDSAKDASLKRGWFYMKPGKPISYYCWNEQCTGTGLYLLAKMQNISLHEAKIQVINRLKEIKSSDTIIPDVPLVEPIKKEIKKLDIPEYFIDVEMNDDAMSILENRLIFEAPYLSENTKFYFSKLHKRIAIPWKVEGEIKTFQYRALYKSQSPKYTFSADKEKPVFVVDEIDDEFPYIFCHEGFFDAIFMKNSVAVGGIKPTVEQREFLINKYPFHEIVYVMDNPWIDTAAKSALFKISEKTPSQKIFLWDRDNNYKDINEEVVATKCVNKYTDTKLLKNHITSAFKFCAQLKFIERKI